MNARFKRVYHYLMDQLSQASTWRGLVMLLTGCGTVIKPELQEAIVPIGLIVVGLVGAVFPDQLKDSN